jgi:hypothetical protein
MSRASGRKNATRTPTADPGPDSPEGREIGESARQDPGGPPINALTGNILNYPTVTQKPATADETFDEYRGMMAHGVPNASEVTEERALMVRDGTLAKQSGTLTPPEVHTPEKPLRPIGVYIVEQGGGGKAITSLAGQKITVPANGTAAVHLAMRDETRSQLYVQVENLTASLSLTGSALPAVPATGVPAQNPNAYPVTVVIAANGATITAVTVNGVVVGTAAGTYVVPPYGSISIAYTVATPTWTWTGTTTPAGIRISHEVGDLDVGFGALIRPGSYQKLDGFQDELFAVSADANQVSVSVIYLFEIPAAA